MHAVPALDVERITLASTCHRCGVELRPPGKRNTVYLERSKAGPWFPRGELPPHHISAGAWPFCTSCARRELV